MNDNMNVLAAYEWAANHTAAMAAAGVNTRTARFSSILDVLCRQRFGIYPPARPIERWKDGPTEHTMLGKAGARGEYRLLSTAHGCSMTPTNARACWTLFGERTPRRIQRKAARVQAKIAAAPFLL